MLGADAFGVTDVEGGGIDDLVALADFFKDEIRSDMDRLRSACDKLETETSAEYWPFPTYGELLFAVR